MTSDRDDASDDDGPADDAPAADRPGRSIGPLTRRAALLLGGVAVASAPFLGNRRREPGPAASTAAGPTTAEHTTASAAEPAALDARTLGAVGDGVADDTAALQALIDGSAASGRAGRVPAGTYRCTAGLLLPAGTHLQLEPGAVLSKDWAARPGLANAFLRNADFAVRSNGVRITGPGTIGAPDHSRTGVVVALFGDDMALSDFTIDTYAGGQAVMFAGDRGRVDRLRIVNSAVSTGTGGIRFIGGDDFRATGCHVESGDDCLQFVPIADPGALLFDMDVRRGSYVGCTGASSVARFLAAGLEWTKGDTPAMRASVVDCSFTDCHSSGTARGIVVRNSHSSGAVERLTVTDCTVEVAGDTDPDVPALRVQVDPAAGGAIRDVSFVRTDVLRPVTGTLRIEGPGVSGLTFEDCTFTAPSGPGKVTAVVDEADAVAFRRCAFSGLPGKRLLVAGASVPAGALSVEDCTFSDIADGTWGVDLAAVTGARVAGSTFRRAAGATTARAVRVEPACSGVVVEGNDLTGLTHRQPITDRAADTVVRHNRGG
ncbi:glycosyl hydrolase family 28-related protein [Modestobacter sp. I12A-02662]|uniref:glycosyl hydrolase family 28-related protein n=1 Tax=Modestobacter sp. I12A-02662 TaxID=1730496 RepID=UPI0034DE7CE3